MGYYTNERGYICYVNSGVSLSNTHGGRSELHLSEMEDVANAIIDKKLDNVMQSINDLILRSINTYSAEVWQSLIASLRDALSVDVVSEVSIAFDNASDIFHSAKAQEYIAKHMHKALDKELAKIRNRSININL